MAYYPHCLVALSGTWSYSDMGSEGWSFGVRVRTPTVGGGHLANPTTYMNAIVAPILAWFAAAGSQMSTKATLKLIKVNNITADGHYENPATVQYATSTAGGLAPTLPAFNCAAVTLETGMHTGRAKRGRIYPPASIGLDVGKGVTIAPSDQVNLLASVKAFLLILYRAEPTGGLQVTPSVMSRVDASSNYVTGVSINSVLDVQRRRKKSATATRSAISSIP